MNTQVLPTATLPDRDKLRTLYDEAINELNASRNNILTTPFYTETGNTVFAAGCRALSDALTDTRQMITVPAPVGAGKTSFAYALMTSVARYADENPGTACGCVLVVEQRVQADRAYRDLVEMLPGKVAVYSSDHDVNCKKQISVMEPAARFSQEDLRHYPVIVVTHQFYLDRNGHKARNIVINGRLVKRALTIIDERPDEAPSIEVLLSEAQAVREALTGIPPDIKKHLDDLLRFMEQYNYAPKNALYRPGVELDAAEITKQLGWFRTDEAGRFAKSVSNVPGVDRLFSFAKALVISKACVATSGALANFFGYETRRVIDLNAGTMLLDATADIDGVSTIVTWRTPMTPPGARYNNLQIVHVPRRTKARISEYLKLASNQRAYVKWMKEIIKQHMAPGELGLVVCKKKLFEAERVPFWPEGDVRFKDPRNYMEGFKWEIYGRRLCATHYGAGIGCNDWNKADVVFLFDAHFIPRRSAVAITQGLRDQPVNEGDFGSMRTMRSKAAGVDAIANGHALRYTKQMALRGKARFYDAKGMCGVQRLVIADDIQRFSANVSSLFPGAKVQYEGNTTAIAQWSVRVTEKLRDASLPSPLSTWRLSDLLGKPWREVSRNVLTVDFKKTIGDLGWRYVPGRGRKGSHFERTPQDQNSGALSKHLPRSTGAALSALG